MRPERLLSAHLIKPHDLVATLALVAVFGIALDLVNGFASQISQPSFDVATRDDECNALTFVAERHAFFGAHISESLNPFVHGFVVRVRRNN